jgi:hypothetical protein
MAQTPKEATTHKRKSPFLSQNKKEKNSKNNKPKNVLPLKFQSSPYNK